MSNLIQISKGAESTAYYAKVCDFGFVLDVYDDGAIVLLVEKDGKTEYMDIRESK